MPWHFNFLHSIFVERQPGQPPGPLDILSRGGLSDFRTSCPEVHRHCQRVKLMIQVFLLKGRSPFAADTHSINPNASSEGRKIAYGKIQEKSYLSDLSVSIDLRGGIGSGPGKGRY